MAQNILWDSRLKTLVVLLPALGILWWVSGELADAEYAAPAAILGPFVAFVAITLFAKTVRFEMIFLCVLVTGYLVGNRGFANLAPFKPLYPGEIGMIVISACLFLRYVLTREGPDFSGWPARIIILYLALGGVRLARDYHIYKLDAIRDSAMVYYAVYYFFGRLLITTPRSEAFLEKCLKFSVVALLPVSIVERVFPELMERFEEYIMISEKDDILNAFAIVGVFFLFTRPGMFRNAWLRPILIMYYIAYVVTGLGRAAILALAVGSVLPLLAGKTRFLLYPAVAVVLGLFGLTAFAVTVGNSQTGDSAAVEDKILSMVDITGSASYHSDYGALKEGTNDFRRKLWTTFIDEANFASPLFGCGFGPNIVAVFDETYHLGGDAQHETLRSAHNFYVTLYGRMGIVGVAIFAVLTWIIISGGIRAALAVKAGRLPLSVLGYWCAVWVVLVVSAVGVVLEGPMGAVIFWVFLGVAIEVSKEPVHQPEPSMEEVADLPALRGSPMRRPLSVYGAIRH